MDAAELPVQRQLSAASGQGHVWMALGESEAQ